MARRSPGVVDAGTPGYPPGGFAPADPWDAPDQKGRRGKSRRGSGGGRGGRRDRGGWGGSGGRWLIYVGRAILWAFLIVVLVNGIRAPFERFTAEPTGPASSNDPAKPQFPQATASSYALSFADVYLNYDSSQTSQAERQRELSQYLSPNVDAQLGWDGTGKSVLRSVQVASVRAEDVNHAIVTLLADANGRLFQLAVPVYAKDGALSISGRPAMLPPPPHASVPVAAADRDSALETELQQPLSGFFKAYATSDTAALQRYSDPPISGLGNAVGFGQLKEIIAPPGAAGSRTVTATVVWQVSPVQNRPAGGTLEQTYRLSMVKKDNTWYVKDIQGSTLPAEQ
jgi:Conjugative transposon protein TcpC